MDNNYSTIDPIRIRRMLHTLEMIVSRLASVNASSWTVLKKKLDHMDVLVKCLATDISESNPEVASFWQQKLATFWAHYGTKQLEVSQFVQNWSETLATSKLPIQR